MADCINRNNTSVTVTYKMTAHNHEDESYIVFFLVDYETYGVLYSDKDPMIVDHNGFEVDTSGHGGGYLEALKDCVTEEMKEA